MSKLQPWSKIQKKLYEATRKFALDKYSWLNSNKGRINRFQTRVKGLYL